MRTVLGSGRPSPPVFAALAERPEPAGSELPHSAMLTVEAKRAFGGLLPLIDRPMLRDVMIHVSTGRGRLWVDEGTGARELPGWHADAETVRRLAVDLIAAGGRHLDELNPCADVRLGGGLRVHAVLPPVSVSGAAISIRVPRNEPFSFERLAASGLATLEQTAWLHRAVLERRNLLISGSTGSGKTTVLAALLDLCPPHERIVTIEDVAELRLTHPHWVALESRQANTEGVGEVPLERLLREALRMRPDRLVLGECRGAEVLTLLAALNTGHDGGAGTIHASSLADVPARLETLGALGGLDAQALARQSRSAFDLVVHLERTAATGHRIAALGRFVLNGDLLGIEVVG